MNPFYFVFDYIVLLLAGMKKYYRSKLATYKKKQRNPNLTQNCARNQRKIHVGSFCFP